MTDNNKNTTPDIHIHSVADLAGQLDTHIHNGLTSDQVRERLVTVGPNELKEKPRPGFLKLLLAQFNHFLIILLIVAAAVSLLLGEYIDAAAIIAIVVLNAVLGVVQESRAEKALAALRKMAAPNAMVVRDGTQQLIPSRELVPLLAELNRNQGLTVIMVTHEESLAREFAGRSVRLSDGKVQAEERWR